MDFTEVINVFNEKIKNVYGRSERFTRYVRREIWPKDVILYKEDGLYFKKDLNKNYDEGEGLELYQLSNEDFYAQDWEYWQGKIVKRSFIKSGEWDAELCYRKMFNGDYVPSIILGEETFWIEGKGKANNYWLDRKIKLTHKHYDKNLLPEIFEKGSYVRDDCDELLQLLKKFYIEIL